MRFVYQAVDRIPKPLLSGVVYHSEEFQIGALLCACGCGHRISLLVPDSHQVTSEGGFATVRPSIAVCDAPCKSHYVISAGRVQWLPAFSGDMAAAVMRDQISRHVVREKKMQPWWQGIVAAIARVFDVLMSILRI